MAKTVAFYAKLMQVRGMKQMAWVTVATTGMQSIGRWTHQRTGWDSVAPLAKCEG